MLLLSCTPGVAELADALDSKSIALRLLKLTHRYSTKHSVYQRSEGGILKLALLCSFLLIVGLQISESPAYAQTQPAGSSTEVKQASSIAVLGGEGFEFIGTLAINVPQWRTYRFGRPAPFCNQELARLQRLRELPG
jgi:hypothetical protein